MPRTTQTWQSVRDEVQRRIQTRIWSAGTLLPTEEALATELGCARVTVNRALRDLAEQGVLDRKRKAGTRVAEYPTRNVRLSVPILRKEIEGQGAQYAHALLLHETTTAPPPIRAALRTADAPLLHLQSLHLADGRPFAFEDRWINLAVVPQAAHADFKQISANEWLVSHVPLTRGDMSFGAVTLDTDTATALSATVGDSALSSQRITWDGNTAVTHVTLTYAPGHRFQTGF